MYTLYNKGKKINTIKDADLVIIGNSKDYNAIIRDCNEDENDEMQIMFLLENIKHHYPIVLGIVTTEDYIEIAELTGTAKEVILRGI